MLRRKLKAGSIEEASQILEVIDEDLSLLRRRLAATPARMPEVDRVRRPRVHITYDVETGGAMKKVELPFVVGVLADLSGQPKEPLRPFKERKAVSIDRDNFNEVLARSEFFRRVTDLLR